MSLAFYRQVRLYSICAEPASSAVHEVALEPDIEKAM